MSQPKLCIDCRFYLKSPNFQNIVCSHPKAHHSLLDGSPNQFCIHLREPRPSASADRTCGPEGKWFEPKPQGE